MPNVYGYARVSTTLQAEEGESLGVQQRQVEGWCHMQGATLAQMFIERGVSGSVPLGERPEGALLLATARKGDTIVAPKLDRVFRSALDALQVIETYRNEASALSC
jgi:putative DNA-invertase from lambdoid prophage Rac